MEKHPATRTALLPFVGRSLIGIWLVATVLRFVSTSVVTAPLVGVLLLLAVVGLAWAHTRRPIPGLAGLTTFLVVFDLTLRFEAAVTTASVNVYLGPFVLFVPALIIAALAVRHRLQLRLAWR